MTCWYNLAMYAMNYILLLNCRRCVLNRSSFRINLVWIITSDHDGVFVVSFSESKKGQSLLVDFILYTQMINKGAEMNQLMHRFGQNIKSVHDLFYFLPESLYFSFVVSSFQRLLRYKFFNSRIYLVYFILYLHYMQHHLFFHVYDTPSMIL